MNGRADVLPPGAGEQSEGFAAPQPWQGEEKRRRELGEARAIS